LGKSLIMNAMPESYEELKLRVMQAHDGLSKQLQKIARYALDNPDNVALDTVTNMAQKADVQPSSIIRFAKAFDYDGFSDLQSVFRNRLMQDTSSYRERVISLSQEGREGPVAVLDEFCEAGMESLNQLQVTTPPVKLNQAVDLIAGAENIHLLGQGRSYAVSEYLHYAFSRLEQRCFLADGAGGMLRHQMNRVAKDDVVIAVSFAPYTPVVVEIVSELSDRRANVISITDSALSPLYSRSTVSFDIQDSSERAFRTLIAPICLAQTLVVAVGQILAARNGITK
jgi:DNA-binding MurR/RpiR family transcriptional regulator